MAQEFNSPFSIRVTEIASVWGGEASALEGQACATDSSRRSIGIDQTSFKYWRPTSRMYMGVGL